jgi:LysR family nod box-dependent transcriptional activator
LSIPLFNLNLLVALDALLSERNVTRAGQRVGLSQPAMSGTLARLREHFNDDLLVRVGRQLELTPLAQELIEPVRHAVRQIETIIEHRRGFDPTVEKRSFTIAASDYATFLLLPPLMERLSREAPGISVKFVKNDVHSQEQIKSDAVDFLILPSELGLNLPGEALFTDRWVCAVWSKHPTVRNGISKEQYLALPHLAFGMAQPTGMSVADVYLEQTGVKSTPVATTESFLLLPFAIRGTNLVAIMHERLAEQVKAAADIRLLEPPFTLPEVHESVYWNPRHGSNPSHIWMRSLIVEVARQL